MHVPDLHVGGIGGVADAERVEEQEAAEVAGDDAGDQAVEAAAAQRREVGRREARGLPLGEGQHGRTDLDAVVVVGRAVGATRPGRVDAAVHGSAAREQDDAEADQRHREPLRTREVLAEEGDAEDRHEDDAELVDGATRLASPSFRARK